MFSKLLTPAILASFLLSNSIASTDTLTYKVIDTNQMSFFSDKTYISTPNKGDKYFGQDASYLGYQAIYQDNKNGTISDIQTGLMWQKSFTEKMTWNEAVKFANESSLGGFSDWRIPTIKELYSLIDFSGKTGTARNKDTTVPSDAKPYINTKYFDFEYSKDRRYIDAQYWTKTKYVSTTMNGNETFFGVNFADGRIKGYPIHGINNHGGKYYLRLVRGNTKYGINSFEDKNNALVKDNATGLTWTKDDFGPFNWNEALSYCENLKIGDDDNFRLPNVKELQSIIDYTKSPDTSNSASINELFNSTKIVNEKSQDDYGFYWSSTTHLDGKQLGSTAAYISFGRTLGYMKNRMFGTKQLLDVHGAGAQRSDPKSGDASVYKGGRGPQGDVIRIDNYVRCVSDNSTKLNTNRKVVQHLLGKTSDSKGLNDFNIQRTHRAIMMFDKNSDDKISFDEAPNKMKRNFNRHDLNGDGFIDSDEVHTLPKPRR